MADTDKNLIPTENLIGSKNRMVTSIWIDSKTHKNFIDACSIAGRKTCSVIESFEKAFTKCIKNHIENKDVCSVKPIIFDHLVINIQEKYAKRGPKMEKSIDKFVFCPKADGKKTFIEGVHTFTCKYECKFGDSAPKHGRKMCPVYEKARFQ